MHTDDKVTCSRVVETNEGNDQVKIVATANPCGNFVEMEFSGTVLHLFQVADVRAIGQALVDAADSLDAA